MEHQERDWAAEAEPLRKKLALVEQWQAARAPETSEPRALVIEFAGMPKAGKSSVIETLRHFFSHGPKMSAGGRNNGDDAHAIKKDGFVVYTPAEGVSLRTPNYLKNDPLDYNTWAGAYAIQELLQARHDYFNDIVILDRGPWDAGCWLKYWAKQTGSDSEVVADFFQLKRWIVLADLHVVLTVNPREAAARERKSRLVAHRGPSSNVGLMNTMRQIYLDSFEALKKTKINDCPHVGEDGALLIDTTNRPSQQVAMEVLAGFFKVLEAKIGARDQGKLVSLEELLSLMPRAMRSADKKKVQAALADIVPKLNELTAGARVRFRTDLSDYTLPESPMMTNRISASDVIGVIEGLLAKVSREG